MKTARMADKTRVEERNTVPGTHPKTLSWKVREQVTSDELRSNVLSAKNHAEEARQGCHADRCARTGISRAPPAAQVVQPGVWR